MTIERDAAAFVPIPCAKTGDVKLVRISKITDQSIDINTLESFASHYYTLQAILPKITNDALIHLSKRQIDSSDTQLLRDILREMTDRLFDEEMLKRFVEEHSW